MGSAGSCVACQNRPSKDKLENRGRPQITNKPAEVELEPEPQLVVELEAEIPEPLLLRKDSEESDRSISVKELSHRSVPLIIDSNYQPFQNCKLK